MLCLNKDCFVRDIWRSSSSNGSPEARSGERRVILFVRNDHMLLSLPVPSWLILILIYIYPASQTKVWISPFKVKLRQNSAHCKRIDTLVHIKKSKHCVSFVQFSLQHYMKINYIFCLIKLKRSKLPPSHKSFSIYSQTPTLETSLSTQNIFLIGSKSNYTIINLAGLSYRIRQEKYKTT